VAPTGEGAWHLEMPPGLQGQYRLAQLDDYGWLSRRTFPWCSPLTLTLRARASAKDLPGTWGFGLWNDPFGMGGSTIRRLPTLPNTAWFFHASPPNYLSFRNDPPLPAQGFLAATFRSPAVPAPLLVLAVPSLALLALPATARGLRRLASRIIQQDAALVRVSTSEVYTGVGSQVDVTDWHTYSISWLSDGVIFNVDDRVIFSTPVVPRGRLGLVLWIDNQYAAWPPNARPSYGTLPNPEPAWIEIEALHLISASA
jgi:hypothetical protein